MEDNVNIDATPNAFKQYTHHNFHKIKELNSFSRTLHMLITNQHLSYNGNEPVTVFDAWPWL